MQILWCNILDIYAVIINSNRCLNIWYKLLRYQVLSKYCYYKKILLNFYYDILLGTVNMKGVVRCE